MQLTDDVSQPVGINSVFDHYKTNCNCKHSTCTKVWDFIMKIDVGLMMLACNVIMKNTYKYWCGGVSYKMS